MTAQLENLNLAIELSGMVLCLLGVLLVRIGTMADKSTERYFLLSDLALLLFQRVRDSGGKGGHALVLLKYIRQGPQKVLCGQSVVTHPHTPRWSGSWRRSWPPAAWCPRRRGTVL